ncbi:MAG: deoxyguanosinetriphosphate triphosphohydrolase [Hyphomicrobium sp.]
MAPEDDFGQFLAPGDRSPARYAASAVPSRGRQHREPECPTRSPFQRDRDRVLHSTAFRRLTHKTQVFVFHEGDHYRSRLTHSLEVAQIARTIARQLRLDEDLAEVLALAHDLGHSPFSHAGERALDGTMRAWGGFDHNAQSLRIVTSLERKYLAFDGLNPTWETLEGLAKHNGPLTRDGVEHGSAGVLKIAGRMTSWQSLEPSTWASAEAQVASLSDDIAYLNHDVDDGLRAGLISLGDLATVPLVGAAVAAVDARGIRAVDGRVVYEVTRRMITAMIRDLVEESRRRLAALDPQGPDDIRLAPAATASFTAAMTSDLHLLKSFLFEHVYRSPRVMRTMAGAETIVRDLFTRYGSDGTAMPETWAQLASGLDERRRARLISDFVAGMTDRYAIAEHRRLFTETPELR